MLSEIFYFYTTTTHMSLSTNNEKTTVKLPPLSCNHMIEKTRKMAGKIFSCRYDVLVVKRRDCCTEFIISQMKVMQAILNELNN